VTGFMMPVATLFLSMQARREGSEDKFFEYSEESKFQALSNSPYCQPGQLLQGSEPLPAERRKRSCQTKNSRDQQLVQLLALTPDGEEIEQRKCKPAPNFRPWKKARSFHRFPPSKFLRLLLVEIWR